LNDVQFWWLMRIMQVFADVSRYFEALQHAGHKSAVGEE
jgi:hypothetical protein